MPDLQGYPCVAHQRPDFTRTDLGVSVRKSNSPFAARVFEHRTQCRKMFWERCSQTVENALGQPEIIRPAAGELGRLSDGRA